MLLLLLCFLYDMGCCIGFACLGWLLDDICLMRLIVVIALIWLALLRFGLGLCLACFRIFGFVHLL